MKQKEITVVFYGRSYPRSDWEYELDEKDLDSFLEDLREELAPLGIALRQSREEGHVMEVRGYGDLLNSVRIRSNQPGMSNPCLGHVIGASANRDLLADIRRGVNRLAFAPETIEPEGSDKIVCHNCGCGC